MYNLTEEKIDFILDVIRPYIQTDKDLKENRKIIHALFNVHKVDLNMKGEKRWTDADVQWIVSTLTPFQRQIVTSLLKGETELTDLISELQKNDPNASGISVGGACAGLHRKCNKRQLPHIVKWRYGDDNKWCYSLEPQALPFLKTNIEVER